MLIGGPALATRVGEETLADEDADMDEGNEGRNLWVGAGAVVASFATGGIVAGYVAS